MSQWHREHPELTGTDSDPWMRHDWYRKLTPIPEEDREAQLAEMAYLRELERKAREDA
jgi:hypothetical protein